MVCMPVLGNCAGLFKYMCKGPDSFLTVLYVVTRVLLLKQHCILNG